MAAGDLLAVSLLLPEGEARRPAVKAVDIVAMESFSTPLSLSLSFSFLFLALSLSFAAAFLSF